MPRGGRRTGAPGASYANRTDLNRPGTAASMPTYGDKAQADRAQRAIPLPRQQPAPSINQLLNAPAPRPSSGPLDRPTERPGEPVTAGLMGGPGPGPEALQPPAADPLIETLRAAYRRFPNEAIAAVLERAEMDAGLR